GRVPRRVARALRRLGLTHRAVRVALALRSHGPAPAAGHGRPAARVARGAAAAPGPRSAGRGANVLGRAAAATLLAATNRGLAHAPGPGLGGAGRDNLGLAHARRLRTRPALARLALPSARVFPGRGAALLVPRRPPVPVPPAVAVVVPVAVPARRRPLEHA